MDGWIHRDEERERDEEENNRFKIRYFMFGFSEQSVVEGGMAAD